MKKTTIFIGGYTQQNSSEGIYRTTFDLETGRFQSPTLFSKLSNPSFLALSKNKSILYAVEELCDKEGEGKLHSICLKNPDNQNTKALSLGEHPCYIGLDESNLLCANYSSGSLSTYPILDCGQINKAKPNSLKLQGKGPNRKRQRSSHAHFFDSINNSIFSVDLGSDTIIEFEKPNLHRSNFFESCKKNEFKTPAGYGPRHLCSNPFSENELWISCELESKILCYQNKSGVWELTQELDSINPQAQESIQKEKVTNYPSHLAFNPKNETLYVANRGHDSISVFQKKDEAWVLIQSFPSNGNFPRHFAISPCGQFMISANQLGNNVTSFKIDSEGLILEVTDSIKHPNPTCILFC